MAGGSPLVRILAIALVAWLVPGLSVAQEVRQGEGRAEANGVEIAYRALGPETGAPILFIQGIGGVTPAEPDPLTLALVDEGYRVILFDNRDAGASTHLAEAGTPDFAAIERALAAGEEPTIRYSLDDMAGDAIGLLDALGVGQAHIVGGSLGGMIAQIVAADHPERTASLTLISSSTGNPGLPRGEPPAGDGETDAGTLRQMAAAAVAGDLRERSAGIAAPAVVVHGDRDELFPIAHGEDLAATIPGARLVVVPGMGHVPEDEHEPTIFDAIRSVAGTGP